MEYWNFCLRKFLGNISQRNNHFLLADSVKAWYITAFTVTNNKLVFGDCLWLGTAIYVQAFGQNFSRSESDSAVHSIMFLE